MLLLFVLVCLCRFLWQIILFTYMSDELVAHFDPSLDLFLGDFWISSHYSLTVYPSKSEQIQWILYWLTVHTRCWSACKQGVVFLLFPLPSWCQMSWWTIFFTVDLSSYQFIREIIDTSKLNIFEAIFRWDTWEDCRLLSTNRCEW